MLACGQDRLLELAADRGDADQKHRFAWLEALIPLVKGRSALLSGRTSAQQGRNPRIV